MVVHFRKSFVAKIALLISVCLVITISINSWQSSLVFFDILEKQSHDSVVSRAKQTASNIEGALNSIRGQIILMVQTIGKNTPDRYPYYSELFVKSNPDFAGFYFMELGASGMPKIYAESAFTTQAEQRLGSLPRDLAQKNLRKAVSDILMKMNQKSPSEFVANLQRESSLPIFMIAVPFSTGDQKEGKVWAVTCIWQTALTNLLQQNESMTSILIDREGKIISAPEIKTLSKAKAPSNPIVNLAKSGVGPIGFKGWTDQNKQPWLGAYSRTKDGKITAIVFMNGSESYQSILKVIVRSAVWTVLMLLAGLMLSSIVASSISKRIVAISLATQQIARGNFRVLMPRGSGDEVDALSNSVSDMANQIVKLLDEKIEKARMEKELETATKIQNMFFGKNQFENSDLRLFSFFTPASECGGDWWGHMQINDRKHLICIADATGHGVPAALVTAIAYSASTLLSATFAKSENLKGAIENLLGELNGLLCRFGDGKMTMTFFAALIDFDSGEMTVANAGHNFPIVLPNIDADARFNGKSNKFKLARGLVTLSVPGTPLGVLSDSSFKEYSLPIEPGDKIVFFTDGLIECKNPAGEMWGAKSFLKNLNALRSHKTEEFHEKIITTAFDHYDNALLDDDVTLVTVEALNFKKSSSENTDSPLGAA